MGEKEEDEYEVSKLLLFVSLIFYPFFFLIILYIPFFPLLAFCPIAYITSTTFLVVLFLCIYFRVSLPDIYLTLPVYLAISTSNCFLFSLYMLICMLQFIGFTPPSMHVGMSAIKGEQAGARCPFRPLDLERTVSAQTLARGWFIPRASQPL